MFDRFTAGARSSAVMAEEEARRRDASTIEIDHLALAVFRTCVDDPGARRLLGRVGVDVPELLSELGPQAPSSTAPVDGVIPFGASSMAVMAQAAVEAHGLGHAHIGIEHLLLAVLAQPDTAAARTLVAAGATREIVLAALDDTEAPGFHVKTTRGRGRFRPGGQKRGGGA